MSSRGMITAKHDSDSPRGTSLRWRVDADLTPGDQTRSSRGDCKNASTTEFTTQEASNEMETDEVINVKVKGPSGEEVFFKIKPHTWMKKLMDAYCTKSGKASSEVRFLFAGTRVNPTDTPDSLGIEENDTIDAMVEQGGG
jgi:small ubiquitin-related modifier